MQIEIDLGAQVCHHKSFPHQGSKKVAFKTTHNKSARFPLTPNVYDKDYMQQGTYICII